MANSSKFRADHIGSLLRPQALLEARRRVDAGMIEPEELREVENEAIAAAVKLQQDAAIDIITDGEFRRLDFRAGFADAFEGISMRMIEMPWRTPDGEEIHPSRQFVIDGRLKQKKRITEGDAAFLRTLTKSALKVTLISPGFLANRFWQDGITDQVYESRDELTQEVVAATRAEIEALFDEGVSYVQLDNPGYAAFLDATSRDRMRTAGADPDAAFERMASADAAAVEGIERPKGASIGIHICRGNHSSHWLAEGDYEPIAERLFSLPVDRLLLEYDDERSGGFAPLRFVPEGKMVVLGLVSSKKPDLESLEELQQRIDEASQHVDIDFLALSPQCGFASVSDGGNRLTAEQEFRKLQLVSDTALATWGIEL
jgi:5-methyltetrahydropteroyltriglutamate--homocysteine methyltransferase